MLTPAAAKTTTKTSAIIRPSEQPDEEELNLPLALKSFLKELDRCTDGFFRCRRLENSTSRSTIASAGTST
jgi:hypothetical protein